MSLLDTLGLSIDNTITNREYTQDYIPVEDIVNGVIIVRKGHHKEYIKILEIIPVNFSLLSPDEQDAIIIRYYKFLRSAPPNFHIKIVTQRTNVSEYLKAAKKAKEEEPVESCRKIIDNYMNFIYEQSAFNSVERHYYFIFNYDVTFSVSRDASQEDIIKSINEKADGFKSDFHAIGHNVVDWNGNPKEIASILYDYYNPRLKSIESFDYRVDRIEHDTMVTHDMTDGQNIPVDIRDLIAPKSLNFMNPEYVLINGLYRTHYFIKANGFPDSIYTGGWLTAFAEFGYGFDLDMFFFKGNSVEAIRNIQLHAKLSTVKINNKEEEEIDFNSTLSNYNGIMYMLNALQQGGEDIYNMVVMITLTAETYQELQAMKKALTDYATKIQVGLAECKRRQEAAFMSVSPFMNLDTNIMSLAKHNLTSNGVAVTYPFTSFSLSDKEGIAVGTTDTGAMVMYDMFDTDKYANANLTIFGEPGHGKTYTLLTMLLRLRCLGIQIFAFAPDKQDEFRRACDAVGGVFADISPASEQRINMFDIRPMTSPENAVLGGASYTEKSWLVDKVENLKIWLSYIISDLSEAEKAVLETCLVDMYEDFGITQDNDSIYLDSSHTKLKEMPIMTDFYNKVKEKVEDGTIRKDIELILAKFITGAASNMNGHTNIDLDNKFIVFGLENLKGDLLAPTMFSVLELVWGKCRENRTKKKMIAIDEGWQLLNGTNTQVGEFVQEIFKVIRGFGGGAIFSTQSVSDLFLGENNYGNAILACSHSNIILGMRRKDIANISKELALSSNEIDSIARAQRGEALFCAGENHIPVLIRASALEHELITTTRKELEAIANRAKKKQEENQE